MTKTLEQAFREAEKLPKEEQNKLAVDVMTKVRELQDKLSQALTRLAEESFGADWDNEKDAVYDNWKQHYDVSEG